jgi:hypothetical protein
MEVYSLDPPPEPTQELTQEPAQGITQQPQQNEQERLRRLAQIRQRLLQQWGHFVRDVEAFLANGALHLGTENRIMRQYDRLQQVTGRVFASGGNLRPTHGAVVRGTSLFRELELRRNQREQERPQQGGQMEHNDADALLTESEGIDRADDVQRDPSPGDDAIEDSSAGDTNATTRSSKRRRRR